jgi:recombinational DNA repair protein (RecF pathway)
MVPTVTLSCLLNFLVYHQFATYQHCQVQQLREISFVKQIEGVQIQIQRVLYISRVNSLITMSIKATEKPTLYNCIRI